MKRAGDVPSPADIARLAAPTLRRGWPLKPAWIPPAPDREQEFQADLAAVHARERADGFGQPPAENRRPQEQGARRERRHEELALGPAVEPAVSTPEAARSGAAGATAAAASPQPAQREPEGRATATADGDAAQGGFRPRQPAAAPAAPAAAMTAASANGPASAAASQARPTAEHAPVTALGSAAAATRRQQPAPAAHAAQGAAVRRSPELQELAQEHQDAIFRRVALAVSETGGEMDVVLDPPELGRVQLHFELEGDQARLVVATDRPEVADQITSNLAGLRAALAAQGIRVDQFDVRDGRSFDGREGGEGGFRPGRRRVRGLEPVPARQAARILHRRLGDGALDILV